MRNEPLSSLELPEYIRHFSFETEPVYFLTVAPGLETIAAAEAEKKAAAVVRGLARGKVFFTVIRAGRSDEFSAAGYNIGGGVPAPRTADNIYRLIYSAETGATRAALTAYPVLLASPQFKLAAAQLSGHFSKRPSFTVNAGISGRHNYSRFEAAAAFGGALQGLYGFTPGENPNRDIEFRLDIIDGHLLVSYKLTGPDFRYRGGRRVFNKAALRPPVAHALVWLSEPFGSETVLDPFCGGGVILQERAAYPYKTVTGCEIDAVTAENARINLNGTGVKVITGDMRRLDIETGGIDTIITNPPWGGQIQTDGLYALYEALFERAAEWLKHKGKIILLTPLDEAVNRAAHGGFCRAGEPYAVSLHGALAYIYVFIRG